MPTPTEEAALIQPPVAEAEPKRHKTETVKEQSCGLAGTIAEELSSPGSHFEDPDVALLKHHGTYQQDNRDERAALKKSGQDKAWIFMVRTKIPGGRLTAEQYLLEDQIASAWTYGSLRITSRQGIQMHGVGKENLKNTIKAINDARLSTLGACGDVNRNVMTCPVSDLDWRAELGMDEMARTIAEYFAPRSTAYYEIWCDGEKYGKAVTPSRDEPIYGKTYLPRKFKMGIAVPEDNCIDLYIHDLSLEAVHDGSRLVGYDVLVGGGMGFTFSKNETYPRLASRLVRINPQEAIEVIETIIKIQRDYGGRVDRHHARLKYLLDDEGLEWFKEELFRRLGRELPDAGPMPVYKTEDHLGWHEDRFGKAFVGIPVENGRIHDVGDARIKTGLREVISRFQPQVRLTPHQNIVLAGLDPGLQGEIDSVLADFGIKTVEQVSTLRRRALACPALPTCGLALADAERVIPSILDKLEELGSADDMIEFRMTGCPNSCVRTPTAEIGISGRGPGKYAVFVGGSPQGTRLAYCLREMVTFEAVPNLLHSLIQSWHKHTKDQESFGDWSDRIGREALEALISNGH